MSKHILLEVSAIAPSPTNPRRIFPDAYLEQLAESIAKVGVLQELTVRLLPTSRQAECPGVTHELVLGECRWRAARLAHEIKVPVQVVDWDRDQVIEAQLVENAHRRDLHPLEEADTYARLLTLPGYTEERVADRTGQKVSHVRERLRLTKLAPRVRELFQIGKLGLEVALLIGRLPAIEALQVEAAEQIAAGEREGGWDAFDGERRADTTRPMSISEARDVLRARFMTRLERATWELDDAALVPAAGACATCPKRTGNQRELFADVKSPDVCTDPTCFRAKTDAAFKVAADAAKARGLKVLPDKEAKAVFGQHVHNTGHTEVKYDAKLVTLDSELPYPYSGAGGSKKTWRSVLKGVPDAPPVVLAKDPLTGAARELVDKAAALKAAQKAGKLKREREPAADPGAAKKEREARAREAERKRVEDAAFTRVCAEIGLGKAPKLERALWRWIALALEDLGHAAERVLERRGLIKEGELAKREVIERFTSKATIDELRGFVLEVLVTETHRYSAGGDPDASLDELCKLLSINREAHLRAAGLAVAAELQAEAAKPKAKPGKKGGRS